MSKATLVKLANLNIFRNQNPEIEFSITKDQRVQAQYSAYDKAKGYDVRGIRATSGDGKTYIRLTISLAEEGSVRQYFNGALFYQKQEPGSKQPEYTGSLNLDNKKDGPKLRLAAWPKQGEKAGPYLSVAISEFREKNAPSSTEGDAFLQEEVVAPVARPVPQARPQAPVQQPRPQARPVPVPAPVFDDMDSDIPF